MTKGSFFSGLCLAIAAVLLVACAPSGDSPATSPPVEVATVPPVPSGSVETPSPAESASVSYSLKPEDTEYSVFDIP